jgi:hypothetical protein
MRIEISDKYTLENEINKLKELSRQQGKKRLYEWVKINHISFAVFSRMLDELPE